MSVPVVIAIRGATFCMSSVITIVSAITTMGPVISSSSVSIVGSM